MRTRACFRSRPSHAAHTAHAVAIGGEHRRGTAPARRRRIRRNSIVRAFRTTRPHRHTHLYAQLNDVTALVPEIVDAIAAARPQADTDVKPSRCSPTAHRTPSSSPCAARTQARRGRGLEELPLSVFFFDCNLHDGVPLIDRPGHQRLKRCRRSWLPISSFPAALRAKRRTPPLSSRRLCGRT